MTKRTIHTSAETASLASSVKKCFLAALNFSSGWTRVNDSDRDITYDGSVYNGIASLGSVSEVREGTSVQMEAITLTLSGVNPAVMSIALDEHYQGREGKLWLAFFDTNDALIQDPVLIFHGVMDTMDIEIGNEAKITVTLTNRFAKWEQFPEIRRYNHEDQTIYYPTDRGLEFVEQTVEKELAWGT